LADTLVASKQMVSGSRCPVWFFDTEIGDLTNQEDSAKQTDHPNYLVVKFFDVETAESHIEKVLELKQANSPEDQTEQISSIEDIRDQVCRRTAMFTQFT
jgi:hypothetical protein